MSISSIIMCGLEIHKDLRFRNYCRKMSEAQDTDSSEKAAEILQDLSHEFWGNEIREIEICRLGTRILVTKEPHPKLFQVASAPATVTKLIKRDDIDRMRRIMTMGAALHHGLTKENVTKASPRMMALFAYYDWDKFYDWIPLLCKREDAFLAGLIDHLHPRLAVKLWSRLSRVRVFSEASLVTIITAANLPTPMSANGARFVLGKLKGVSITKDPVAVILRNKDALIEYGCTIDTAAHFDCLGFAEIIKEYTCLCPEPKVIVGDYYSLEMNNAYKRLVKRPRKADL